MIVNAPPCPSPNEQAIQERKNLKLWTTAPQLDVFLAQMKQHCKITRLLREEATK